MLGWALLATQVAFTGATPFVALPFNSQVPVVARVGEPYEFQFSDSTFAPGTTNYTYSISDQPAWLLLDSATRTLSGAPSSADVGASSFTLTAADDSGAAHMPCVLVVSTDPPPRIEWSVTQQLETTVNLSSNDAPVITILPLQPFHFDFRQDSFIDIVQRKLNYYATLTDHTPLPAWLIFDDQALTFSGASPQLSAFPQAWDIELIASDVEGFAGAAASFTLAIGMQQLVFVPEVQQVNMTARVDFKYTGLADSLFLNGETVDPVGLRKATASAPSWLVFDPATLGFSGVVPSDAPDQNITISVTDERGNQATAIVSLSNGIASPFAAEMPSLTARYGEKFSYQFPDSLFTSQAPQLIVVLPETATWLHFDSATRTLSGTVPNNPADSLIQATITVNPSTGGSGESRPFTIELEAPAAKTTPSRWTTSHPPASPTATLPPSILVAGDQTHHLSSGAVIGIIVGTIVVVAIVAILLVVCWRRRRRNDGYVEAVSPEKRTISRPILPPDAGIIAVTTEMHTDVEKQAGMRGPLPAQTEPPPQIALELPTPAGKNRMKWSKRFSRISVASSIGHGEDAILADTNIPTWGAQSTALHTPHDSFAVPSEIARSSRQLSDLSPTKAVLRRMRHKRESRQSVGLGIDTGGALLLPRHSSKGARTRRRAGSSVGHSTMQDRSSLFTQSTTRTSVLSTQPSDFPRPPTRTTLTDSRSILTWGRDDDGKRKSVRLVARRPSTLDQRSLQDKRQSFIRNRASTSLASPLFAHGSRVPADPRANRNSSANGSVAGSNRRSRRGLSQLTSFSESSSLEPPPRDPRRLSARVRSAFAPSFPRAVTKSTIGADDEAGPGDDDSEYSSTSESITESDLAAMDADLAAQMALPRHKRNFVVPGEASPTPPPVPPTSRQPSSLRGTQPSSDGSRPRQKWKDRLRERSSSPLSTAVAVPVSDNHAEVEAAKARAKRRSRLSEPMSLVSNDSLSKPKLERPRLVHTTSKRPVSVERIQRLSSLRAETEDARPGSEMFEAMAGAGLMPPTVVGEGRDGTQRSDRSGPAFI